MIYEPTRVKARAAIMRRNPSAFYHKIVEGAKENGALDKENARPSASVVAGGADSDFYFAGGSTVNFEE